MHSEEASECPSVPESPTKVHPETGSLEVPTGPTSFEVPVNLPGSVHSVLVHDATDAKDKNKSKGPVDPGGKVCTVVVANDLPAALEIKFAEEAKVLYPKRYHKFRTAVTRDSVMQICLRDNPKISGSCQVSGALTLHASKSFGSFGVEARHFLENEKKQVQRERCLLLDRKKQMEKELAIERREHVLWYFPFIVLCTLLGIGLLALCIVVEPQGPVSSVGLSSAVVVLLCCLGLCGSNFQIFGARFNSGLLKWLAFHAGSAFFFLAALGAAAAIARYIFAGYWWAGLSAGLPCCCISGLMGLYFSRTSLEENIKREEDDDKQSVAERTIVFHGSILEGKGPCVSSWPGKYESAWDVLVTGSRKGNVSAAVVFLPEGSEHFGCHDPIPEEENLEGSCWCIPVYGEQKRWGCRWWTKWMNNIEEAVRQGAELEVYFFAGMVGKGKVENFSMAGKEHLRREAIQGKLKQFLKSSEFQAIDRGIECLWKEHRSDGSSQYSREVHRLFLASLSEEDRKLLQASEGLGNSQKAEVAWLERKGFAYTERDVSAWLA